MGETRGDLSKLLDPNYFFYIDQYINNFTVRWN